MNPIVSRTSRQPETLRNRVVEAIEPSARCDAHHPDRLSRQLETSGFWRLELPKHRLFWSEEVYRIFGIDPQSQTIDLASALNGYHPEDRDRVRGIISDVIASGRPFSFLARALRPDGEVRQVMVRGTREPRRRANRSAIAGLIIDVTDLNQVQTRLEESEDQFRLLVECVTDYAIYKLDAEGRITNWNRGAERIKGYTAAEVVGAHFSRFYDQADRAAGIPDDALRTAAATGHFQGEGWRIRKDGQRFWASVVIQAMRTEGGRLVGFAKITRDITERRSAELALAEREASYRLLADHATDMVIRRSVDGALTYVSPSSEELLGFTPGELLAMPHSSPVHEDDVATVERLMDDLSRGIITQGTVVHRNRHRDGRWIWVEARFRLVRGEDGKPAEVIVAARDIGERVVAEEALRAGEARYRALADALPQLVWIATVDDGVATYVNKGFDDYCGPIGTSRSARLSLVHLEDVAAVDALWRDVVAELVPRSAEARLRRRDGAYRWHRFVSLPIHVAGELIGVLCTALDLDEIVTARTELQHTTELLRLAQDSAGAGLWEWDVAAGRVRHSPESARLFHFPEESIAAANSFVECAEQDWVSRVRPDELPRIGQNLRDTIVNRSKKYECEFRLAEVEGLERWINAVAHIDYDPVSGDAIRFVGLHFDVTERKAAEEALRLSQQRLALALDSGSDGLWDWNIATGAVEFSGQYFRTLGYAVGDIAPRIASWSELVHEEDSGNALELMRKHLGGQLPLYECEFRIRTKSGSHRWTLARGKVVCRDPAGRARRMVGTYIDVTKRKQAEQQIAHMAAHDALTGLPNRTSFRERLNREIVRRGEHGDEFAILACDLDGFKIVNDTLGHPMGDALLCILSRRLQSVVGAGDMIARLGGDEFAVILSGIEGPRDASALARKVIDCVGQPFDLDGQMTSVGVSIGIVVGLAGETDPDRLFKNADIALYRAKAAGGNSYRIYEPGMADDVIARNALEQDLRIAVRQGAFALEYQPIVTLSTGKVGGFEALMRWPHPTRGSIAPAEFIPLAEKSGMIVPLGTWALREACREAARWPGDLRVAVNVSAVQFQNPGLEQSVLSALAASGLAPTRLELEVTESILIEDGEAAIACLHRLRGLGVRVALDDFGTGFSSLSYLRRFPFDKIKIDRSFIRDISNPDTAAIVRAIVGIGERLGSAITAEGVETGEQLEQVRREGCTEVQGYHYSKPLQAAAALAFVLEHNERAAA